MPAGTGYTSQRRYARRTGNPTKKTNHKRKRSNRRYKKGKVAHALSNTLIKKLDKRYVEEAEAETKLSPFFNTTNWNELNTYGGGIGLGPTMLNPAINNAPIAPCSLCTNTGTGAAPWAITGNIFQFGRNLSTDMVNYNNQFSPVTQFGQEPAFPIHGLGWLNPIQTGTPIPLGTNPTRLMDGQYINLRRSTLNFSINMSTVDPSTARSFNYPCQFRVMHVTARRDKSPAGIVHSPTDSLWLKENGDVAGLDDLYDQTASSRTKTSKQQAMKYPINRQYFRVHTDFGFQLQNPCIQYGMEDQPVSDSFSTFTNGSYSFPTQKQFTITRDWGSNNKTIMAADPSSSIGEFTPRDENYKDYIIIIAVRGLCSPSSAGGLLNTPCFGKGKGYTVSFFGTTSAKDL